MRTNGDKPQVWHPPRRKKILLVHKGDSKMKKKGDFWPSRAPQARQWCQYMDGILSEAESHRANQTSGEKKSSYSIGRSSNHMEMSGVLEEQEDKAPPDCQWAGWGQGVVWDAVLGSSTSALLWITPKDWGKVFFPVWTEMATCNFFQKNVIGCCPESLLWSYLTALCHSCLLKRCIFKPGHGNTRVWMKSLFICFGSWQYNPSSVQFPAIQCW